MHPDHTTRPIESASITLVLPAWNEAEVIATAIDEADVALRQVTDKFEIIVVDDGSSDSTAEIVTSVTIDNTSLRLVRHSANQGYGAAIRSGFAAARYDLVVFTDADCQFDLTELDRFVLLANRYDIVCGYRIDRKDAPLRCLYSKVYNSIVRAMLGTGVRDVDCALKMFHRNVAQDLQISGNGFLVNSEIMVQANRRGHRVVEVGVSHRPRTIGESTVSVRHIPKVLAGIAKYWWNEIQFPAATSIHSPSGSVEPKRGGGRLHPAANFRLAQWTLLVIAAVFMLTNLGYPLIDRDETRYAEIPREMLATGNWILPQLNFQTYYDKPPLLYWLCAISFKCFGISETSARLVPALAALVTLGSTMFFGSRIFDRRIGLFSGIVLMLSVGFAFTSRYLLLDGLLSLFVSLSLFTAYEAIRPSSQSTRPRGVANEAKEVRVKVRLGWWVASGICIGLAFLTKGPLAIVLWLPPVLAMAWLTNGHARPRWWHYGILGSVASSIAMPWFVMVHQQDPRFLMEFFYQHNVARFAGEFHSKPIWYFVPVLLLAGHPWSFLTIPYAKFLLGRDDESRSRRTPAIGFLLLWSGWCFVFFTLSKCKLPTYLLPAAPALALMIGHYLNVVLRDAGNPSRHFFARFWSARTATATTCLAAVGFVVFIMVSGFEATVTIYAWAMIWTLLLTISVLLMADRHQARIAWMTSTGVAFLFSVMMMHQILPAYSRSQTLFGDSSPLISKLAISQQSKIATINHEFSEVPFYLGRSDIPNFADTKDGNLQHFVDENQNCLLIVEQDVATTELRENLPMGTKLEEIGRRGVAKIYKVEQLPSGTQIASHPTKTFQDSQR